LQYAPFSINLIEQLNAFVEVDEKRPQFDDEHIIEFDKKTGEVIVRFKILM
jgi:hypothetical protein